MNRLSHLHSPPASGRRVRVRAGAGGFSPLNPVCSLLLQSSHALPALFPSLVLTSVVGLCRLLAKIGGSGGGLVSSGDETRSPMFRRREEAARVLVTAGSGGGSLLRIYCAVLV
ncbi:hypothetical protein F2Q68_00019697 [Brassica cretica]|uniref:Uncharacterized protein n=1 Tax=Brassica cretica TaxID=69181 RepID=A0A8S9FV32_BRACR|nr:hypothetical protein F2Q68_00019697 [Brassica cretica]